MWEKSIGFWSSLQLSEFIKKVEEAKGEPIKVEAFQYLQTLFNRFANDHVSLSKRPRQYRESGSLNGIPYQFVVYVEQGVTRG